MRSNIDSYHLEMPVPLLRAMFAKDYASHFGDAASKIAATELGQAHFNDIMGDQNVAKAGAGINTLFFLLLIGAEIQSGLGARKRPYLYIDYAGERFEDIFGQKGVSTLANSLQTVYPMKTSEFPLSPIDAACGLYQRLLPRWFVKHSR